MNHRPISRWRVAVPTVLTALGCLTVAACSSGGIAQWVYGPGTTLSIKDSTPEIQAANPASHVSSRTAPFIEMHGTQDHFVSASQTLIVHEALRAKGVESTRYVLDGADHGDLSVSGDTAAWNTQQTMGYVLEFLNKHLS